MTLIVIVPRCQYAAPLSEEARFRSEQRAFFFFSFSLKASQTPTRNAQRASTTPNTTVPARAENTRSVHGADHGEKTCNPRPRGNVRGLLDCRDPRKRASFSAYRPAPVTPRRAHTPPSPVHRPRPLGKGMSPFPFVTKNQRPVVRHTARTLAGDASHGTWRHTCSYRILYESRRRRGGAARDARPVRSSYGRQVGLAPRGVRPPVHLPCARRARTFTSHHTTRHGHGRPCSKREPRHPPARTEANRGRGGARGARSAARVCAALSLCKQMVQCNRACHCEQTLANPAIHWES